MFSMFSRQVAVLRAVAGCWAVGAAMSGGLPVDVAEPVVPVTSDGHPIPSIERAVDFATEVFPVLQQSCFDCHGEDQQKAGLRLDSSEAVWKGGKSGPTLVRDQGGKSLLFIRIAGLHGEDPMPPKGDQLTPEQMGLVKAWIDQGAPWPDGVGAASSEVTAHWAYVRPAGTKPPEVKQPGWVRNDIDRFVVARLEAEGLKPAFVAARTALIRRVSLDLIGLPPSPAEIDAFLKDRRPGAYERLVERLLVSPHYGERWARPWLDLARYADTNGYEKDDRRSNWLYRDWVIDALNRDLPFDRFTIEQLAGDLLPDATREQRIATGFHRNTMINTEGGTDDEEFRTAAVIDRVNTTFSVWMGTTMSCAQCHNHKYDPFTQREYFQTFAFFNQTRDGGKALDPILEAPSPEQAAKRAEVRARIEPLQKQLDTATPELETAQGAWEAELQGHRQLVATGWHLPESAEASATHDVNLARQPDGSWLASAVSLPDTSVYTITLPAPDGAVSAIRVEALTDERLPQKSSGLSVDGEFVLTDATFHVEAPGHEPGKVDLEKAYADFAEERFEVAKAIDGDLKSGWAIGADQEKNRTNRHAVFVAKHPTNTTGLARLVIRLKQESNRPQQLLGRFRLALSTAPVESLRAWGGLPPHVRLLLETEAGARTEPQQADLARHYRSIAPSLDAVRAAIAELRKEEPKGIPSTLVLQAVEKPRSTHLFKRGNFLDPGDEVSAATPSVLNPFPADQPRDRLGFARWLVSPENPLVARVAVNRLWEAHFGRGLVETSEDFGAQGERPTHPELLDWLAEEFVRQQWSLKAMHRLIVNSATYRQSSVAPESLVQLDPYNRLLARGPRFRMEAEMIRDHALATSGLLNPALGGPSVFPSQPEGVWAMPYSDDKWITNTNGNQFRRGLYTFARRSFPYAAFATFDAPSREVCTERRPRTNTPVQALTTLNDPAFLAAAAGLARRTLAEGGRTDRQRLTFAFRCVVAREPRGREARIVIELYRRALERFRADPIAAEQLATSGLEAPDDRARFAELAAWTVVANVLLNLDEALNKG
ncbi:MAG: PSD1 and planctomycete cytochrome C domain-containing protein [Limisphaerales bacterium]